MGCNVVISLKHTRGDLQRCSLNSVTAFQGKFTFQPNLPAPKILGRPRDKREKNFLGVNKDTEQTDGPAPAGPR